MSDFELMQNVTKTVIFRQVVAAGSSGYLSSFLTGHGLITGVTVRFAPGEGGTLHIRPVAKLPGEITIDLFQYASNGLQYVSGDDETVESSVQYEVENHTELRIYYDNTGGAESFVNVNIQVMYFQVVEPVNVIGPIGKRGLI